MRAKVLEDFEALREKNIMDIKKAKEGGRNVVGTYCLYSPTEVILAAGAIAISLCGTKQEPIPAAEKVLPRNLCPLVKSSYGFAATDTCPYLHFSDLLVAETTCDGKKKMYELLTEIKPVHLLQLPQRNDSKEDLEYWYNEVKKLKERLEEQFGVKITDESLKDAIKIKNKERQARKALQDVPKIKPSPISGLDLLMALFMRGFCLNTEEKINMVEKLVTELKEIAIRGESPFTEDTPRIMLTGVPVGMGSHKVVQIIEECGGNVVCFENCSGYRGVYEPVSEEGDPLKAIAEKKLKVPCSCMSPNPGRLELISHLADEFQVDGVIDLTWQACHTFNIESCLVQRFVQETKKLPFLHIETDYSESDVEQLRVRIEAFLEMLGQQF